MFGVAVCAHSACVRPSIAVVSGLVVLRRREGNEPRAVAQHDETDLFAFQKLFDHQPRTEQCRKCGFGFRAVMRDHYALACREAVCLQYYREAELVERLASFIERSHGAMPSSRNTGADHEVLCERLAAFQLRGLRGRPDDREVRHAEDVHHTGHQRRLGTDHRQVDLFPREVAAKRQRSSRRTELRPTSAMPGLPGAA